MFFIGSWVLLNRLFFSFKLLRTIVASLQTSFLIWPTWKMNTHIRMLIICLICNRHNMDRLNHYHIPLLYGIRSRLNFLICFSPALILEITQIKRELDKKCYHILFQYANLSNLRNICKKGQYKYSLFKTNQLYYNLMYLIIFDFL